MSPRAKAYIFLLITAIIWGWASPVIKFTTGYLPPFIFLAYRFGISSLIAVASLAALRHQLPKNPQAWFATILYGFIVSTLTLSLLFWGAAYSSSLVTALSSAIQPLLASAAGVFFLHEHVTRREKTGISLAVLGTLVVTFEPLIGKNLHLGTFLGNVLLIASRLTDTASSILAKHLLRLKISPLVLTHLSFITGFLTILPITLYFHPPGAVRLILSTAPTSAHAGVLYMALLSGTLAYTLWHAAEKSIEVGEATVSFYLHPVLAAPLSIFWLKEPLTPAFLIGSAIITSGVILAEVKKRHL